MRGRSMMEGLLAWIPDMDWSSPRFCRECLTLIEAKESLVSKRSGQVSLTQLKPMDFIPFEITSRGWWLNPSATEVSKCDAQLTHASFILFPLSFTIHRPSVWSGRAVTVTMESSSSTITDNVAICGNPQEHPIIFSVLTFQV